MANRSGEAARWEGGLPFQGRVWPRWKPFGRPAGICPERPIAALDRLDIEPLFLRLTALRWAILPQTSMALVMRLRPSTSATAGFVLDALEQAIHARRPGPDDGLIHHSDRGVQYLAMNYTQRLAEANLVPSVGSVGDNYDNALAETINGFYKAEVIWRQRSWPSASAVEMATLRWVDWFNKHRLFGPIGHIQPAEAEASYYAANEALDMVA